MVQQCVEAGLVNGSLLHVDSTIVKASASKDSVVTSGPELVQALRQAYQQQRSKLEVLPEEVNASPATAQARDQGPGTETLASACVPATQSPVALPEAEPQTTATS